MPPRTRCSGLLCCSLLLAVNQAVREASAAGQERCQVILTSGYGYRQFIPLEAALATPGDTDPMDGYPAPAAPGPAPTPPPHLRPGNTTPAMRGNATGPGGSPPASGSSPPPLPERLVLRFHVMAESDAHILLSAQRRSDREAYEVVLGAGNNTYTDFRRLPASLPPRRAFNYSAGVVSGAELRAFWLLVDLRTGVLAVGPAGGAPILAWVDPEPLRVRYLSLCTWTDVEGMWLYGCENRGDTSPTGALDAEWMGPAERLRQHVLVPHKKSPPHHAVDVRVRLDVDRFAVDDRLGVLTVFGTLVSEWQDDRQTWTPADFAGLNATALVSPTDVWLPHLQVADPVLPASSGLLRGALGGGLRLHLDADGRLRARGPVELLARCSLERGGGAVEEYVCDLGVVASPPAFVLLEAPNSPAPENAPRWAWMAAHSVEPANDSAQDATGRNNTEGEELDTRSGASFLRIRVRHRGSRITGVFLAAYIAACSCCVLGLLCPAPTPRSPEAPPRGPLAALTLLMTAVAVLSMQAALPPAVLTAAPSSVSCLSAALAVAAAALLLQTLPWAGCPCVDDAVLEAPRPPPLHLPQLPRALNKLLRSATLARVLLCHNGPPERPRWRACPSGTPTEQVLEMLDAMDAEEARRDWHMLAVVLERVASVIYLILVLAAMVPSLMRAS
ncbi:uncharacterized protein LOC113214417 [Frankliniella occidentalis]|uniref:Uncharacterized protein LOC113214417 n=1 Tax=Frankliniella occidentalis TaxID=133901 RepID=A0A6J1T7I4_FRAOC|nr:uncharacterized protein LOC113214417 [Frankliniella occidentalis]